jgi:RNA polymerase-binding transcription factor
MLGRMNDASDQVDVRRLLEAKLADVEEQLTTMVKPPTEQGNISFGKRVGDGTQMAVDRLAQVAVHDRLQLVRDDTIRALAKLDEGSYGRCDVCGRPISTERLEALPWALLCVQDAGRRDRS